MATLSDKEAFEVAYEEAKKGFEEGGVPVRRHERPLLSPVDIHSLTRSTDWRRFGLGRRQAHGQRPQPARPERLGHPPRRDVGSFQLGSPAGVGVQGLDHVHDSQSLRHVHGCVLAVRRVARRDWRERYLFGRRGVLEAARRRGGCAQRQAVQQVDGRFYCAEPGPVERGHWRGGADADEEGDDRVGVAT